MNNIKNKKSLKLFGITVLSLSLAITAEAALATYSGTQSYNASAETLSTSTELDYISGKYDVSGDHVYDVITIDRLNLLLGDETYAGKSVIVFADVESEVAQAAIPAINTKAKDLGIEKIYYFDLLLASAEYDENGVNVWDDTESHWPADETVTVSNGSTVGYTQAFVTLGSALKNSTVLSALSADYTAADDVYLFVVDGDGTTDNKKKITSSVLIQDANDLKQTETETLLNTVIENGASVATTYGQYDYFNEQSAWGAPNAYYDYGYSDYSQFEGNFKLRAITYYELRYLLDQEGTYNILISGSWCGDSKRAVPAVIEYSSNYDSDTVYVFDFRLSGGLSTGGVTTKSTYTSIIGSEGYNEDAGTTTDLTLVGHLGAVVLEKLGKDFPTGEDNTRKSYVADGKVTVNAGGYVETPLTESKSFRSPALYRYNKDAESPVVDYWLHEAQDWEIPYSVDDNGDPLYSEGTLIDYELGSGSLSATQKTLGLYDLYVFFTGEEITYSAPGAVLTEPSSETDSGCGDDNDPINDLGQDTLVPNQGSSSYDVSHYNISISLKEGTTAERATFEGETTITATALKDLDGLVSFDFRQQTIASVTLADVTAEKSYEVTYTQKNDDELDWQKIIINFDGTISEGSVFEVTIKYTTYTVDYEVANNNSPQGFNVNTDGKGYTAIGEPFGATYWFPNNNTPNDGATYTINLNAPSDYTAVSSGVKSATSPQEDGTITTTWKVTQDTASYQLFALYSTNIIELGSISTKISTYTTADGEELPIYCYVNKDIYAGNRAKVAQFYGKLAYYVSTLEEILGAYPGEALGFVFEDVGDGNGGSASWGAVETKDRPFYTSSSVTGENTFVHELAHQWFGNAVRIDSWNSLWLNEGFATFATDLFYEYTSEDGSFTTSAKYQEYYDGHREESLVWATAPADVKKESELFGGARSPYNRGALALAVLRDDLGDDTFFTIFKGWVADNKGEAKNTEDFISYAESISGKDLTEFASTWLYGTEKPEAFTLSGTVSTGTNSTTNSNASTGSTGDVTDTSDGGLSSGAVVGIVVGSVAVVGIAGGLIFYFVKRKQKKA